MGSALMAGDLHSEGFPIDVHPRGSENGWRQTIIGWVAFLLCFGMYCSLLVAYDGWLGWDDSSHCAISLSRLREAKSSEYPLPLRLLESYSHVAPRPPLTSLIFSAVLACFAKEQFLTALYVMLFGMTLIQAGLVWWLACRVGGPWGASWSLLCLPGSVINVSMSQRMIAELPLSILYLSTAWTYVREIRKPAWHNEFFAGLLIGTAMLVKQTAPVTFGIGMLIVLTVQVRRGLYAEALRAVCLATAGILTASLWWYVPNMTALVDYVIFALNSDGYFSDNNPYTVPTRLFAYGLIIWGPLGTLAWLFIIPWFRPPVDDLKIEDRGWLATIGLTTAGVVLLLSLRVFHFEPRYFHATFPVLAVIAGIVIEQIGRRGRWWAQVAVGLLALASLAFVAHLTVEEPKSHTDWSAISFLEGLGDENQQKVMRIALVGNTGDWTDDKWRLLNELTRRPEGRDFTQFTGPHGFQVPEWRQRILEFDYVLVLKELKPALGESHSMEHLNIDYPEIKAFVESSTEIFEAVPSRNFLVPAGYVLYRIKSRHSS